MQGLGSFYTFFLISWLRQDFTVKILICCKQILHLGFGQLQQGQLLDQISQCFFIDSLATELLLFSLFHFSSPPQRNFSSMDRNTQSSLLGSQLSLNCGFTIRSSHMGCFELRIVIIFSMYSFCIYFYMISLSRYSQVFTISSRNTYYLLKPFPSLWITMPQVRATFSSSFGCMSQQADRICTTSDLFFRNMMCSTLGSLFVSEIRSMQQREKPTGDRNLRANRNLIMTPSFLSPHSSSNLGSYSGLLPMKQAAALKQGFSKCGQMLREQDEAKSRMFLSSAAFLAFSPSRWPILGSFVVDFQNKIWKSSGSCLIYYWILLRFSKIGTRNWLQLMLESLIISDFSSLRAQIQSKSITLYRNRTNLFIPGPSQFSSRFSQILYPQQKYGASRVCSISRSGVFILGRSSLLQRLSKNMISYGKISESYLLKILNTGSFVSLTKLVDTVLVLVMAQCVQKSNTPSGDLDLPLCTCSQTPRYRYLNYSRLTAFQCSSRSKIAEQLPQRTAKSASGTFPKNYLRVLKINLSSSLLLSLFLCK